MAHALGITDGTTTISLSTTNWMLLQYTPNVPSYRNGKYDPVTDSIELSTDTASGATAQTAINDVQRLLEQARRRNETKSGERVYLTLQLDSDGSSWRSEVLSGQMVSSGDTLRAWQGIQPQTLVVERVPFWEGAEQTLLDGWSMSNSIGSGNTHYTGATVDGVLPTPPIVTMKNESGSSMATRDIYFGINAFNDPATFDGAISGAELADTAPYTYSTVQWSQLLSTAELAALQGDNTRFVGAFDGGFTDEIWWKITQDYSNITEIASTSPIYAPFNLTSPELLDFGSMRLPAGGYSTNASNIYLQIKTQSDATNLSCTLTALQMFPANNTRHYEYNAATMPTTYAIVDDGVDGTVYTSYSAYRHESTTAIGLPLMLYPGQGHRIIFVMRTSTGYTTGDSLEFTIAYRPRRITI